MLNIIISLVSPCATFNEEELRQAHINLAKYHYQIDKDTVIRSASPIFVNGSKEERIKELVITEEETKAIALWCMRGGVGAIELIDSYIPPNRNLPLIGFSDVTILHLHRFLHDKRIGIHAAVAKNMDNQDEQTILRKLLLSDKSITYPKLTLINNKNDKNIEGHLLVMNLTSLQTMLGAIDTNVFKNTILAIEDNNIKHYQWYRAMHQLKNANVLSNIKGLIVGHIDNDRDACLQTIKKLSQDYNFSLFDWPYFGHQSPNLPLIFGSFVNLIKINNNEYELNYQ